MREPQQFYSPEDYAMIMDLSRDNVYLLLRKGAIPYKRIGRQYRIPKSALELTHNVKSDKESKVA